MAQRHTSDYSFIDMQSFAIFETEKGINYFPNNLGVEIMAKIQEVHVKSISLTGAHRKTNTCTFPVFVFGFGIKNILNFQGSRFKK